MEISWANDPAVGYLKEAASFMNQIIITDSINEIDRMIMEASGAVDPAVEASNKRNKENAKGASNALVKAATAVIKMIRNIISSIGDFIHKIFMSSEERKGFDELKKEIESNPEFKGKKLRVKDYRKIRSEYEKLIKETEAKIREVEANGDADINDLTKRIQKLLTGVPADAITIVGAEAALRMASSDIGLARLMSKQLKNDESALSKLLKENMGEKDAAAVKRSIDACGKKISLRRLLVRLRHGEYQTAQEAITSIYTDAQKLVSGSPKEMIKAASKLSGVAKNVVNNPNDLGNITRTAIKTAVDEEVVKPLKTKMPKNPFKEDKRQIGKDTEKFLGVDKLRGKITGKDKK